MIRPATPDDAAQIATIYNKYVVGTTISFETEPVSETEMGERIKMISSDHPYLVYEHDGKILGYCYAHPWKERAAYSATWETTVYLDSEHTGRGVGRALMSELIRLCREADAHALIACVTSENKTSVDFHKRLGFTEVSHFEQVGHKFGRWLDVTDLELLL